jgi:uncharacterized protein (UPF0335 family)
MQEGILKELISMVENMPDKESAELNQTLKKVYNEMNLDIYNSSDGELIGLRKRLNKEK